MGIAKYYKYKNCIIILSEHRTFSVSVIKNGQRVKDIKLKKEFIANKNSCLQKQRAECFPNKNGYFHYRDDYDDSFYISNVSNLEESASEMQQKEQAMPDIGQYSYWDLKLVNDSTIAPQPILNEEEIENKAEDYKYYEIGQKNKKLADKMKQRLNKKRFELLNTVCLSFDALDDYVNDMFVGPNKGKDIPQNDDFAHLITRYNRGNNPDVHYLKVERNSQFYTERKAPFNDSLCYSAFDVILALNEILNECNDQNVFEKKEENDDDEKDEIAVILVGSMANFYGDFVSEFVDLYNGDEEFKGFKVKYVTEYVENEGTTNIEDRSSALQQLIQSAVKPDEVANFKSISDIKNEIIIHAENEISDDDTSQVLDKENIESTDSKEVDIIVPVSPQIAKNSSLKSKFTKLFRNRKK